MSFIIETLPKAPFNIVRITDTVANVHIDIATKGGLLNSWVQSPQMEGWDVIDGNDFENGWHNFEATGFKSGKMNPFSCRLFNGQYEYDLKHYQIEKFYLGEHAIHGLLYDAAFTITATETNQEQGTVMLSYDYHKEDKGFPFEYSVSIQWSLKKGNIVTAKTTITSKDTQSFPMMDGWHPYFTLGENINDCTIQFTNNGILAYNEALIPTGKVLPHHAFESGQKLAGIELDNGYLIDKNNPACILENNKYKLVVTPDENYAYLQLYTPAHRKSIAIENLSAAPDCFNNKMGLHIMQPQEIWSLETSFQLFYK